MLKNIFSLTGVKVLSKTEQQPINGGRMPEEETLSGEAMVY